MDNSRKNRIIAVIGTIAFHLIVLVIMLCMALSYPPKNKKIDEPKSEILFGGEYVMIGNIPNQFKTQNDQQSPSVSDIKGDDTGNDMVDEGTVGEPSQLITSTQESPMTIQKKETPEKTGPTKEELAQQEKERKQKEAAERINNRVQFTGNRGTGSGNAGSPDGNSSTGALLGAPGFDLKGRTAEAWGSPKSRSLSGKIVIKVRVNRQGRVTSAEYAGGEGPAAANTSVRQSCIQASLDSKFSVNLNAAAEQTGTITWRFI